MRNALTLWCTSLLVLGQLIGCDERGPTVDAAMDGRPPADKAWEDAASEPPEDWNAPDAEVDARADGTADRRDTATPDADVAVDEEGGADVRDTSVDDGEASSVVFLDRPAPMDGLIEGVDVTTPDEGAVAFDVGDGCSVPRFGAPYDAGPPCSPGRTRACTCSGGRLGAERCESTGLWDPCVCVSTDAGVAVVDGEVIVPERPIPWIGRPRLLAPQSGMRVTSQRPTLRWMLPSGIERARVELCADRPCARMLAQQEVRGDRWRPTTALAAGVVFWRVRGLDATGAVRWTSATWEFGVRHRDLGVDTSYGALKDFNGDGYDDLVTSQGSRGFLVYTGSSAGIAAARVLELGAYGDDGSRDLTELVEQAGIGDFNGDGLADLAFGSGAFGRAYVHHADADSCGRMLKTCQVSCG